MSKTNVCYKNSNVAKEDFEILNNKNNVEFESDFIINCAQNSYAGDSIIYKALYKGKYVVDGKKVYIWDEDNSKWTEDTKRQYRADMNSIAEVYYNEAERIEKSSAPIDKLRVKTKTTELLRKSAQRINDPSKCDKIFSKALEGDDGFTFDGKWDAGSYILPCPNGVYDFRTRKFRKAKPEEYITKTSNVSYDPKADCPRFKAAILASLGGDKELFDYLMTALGASLLKDPRDEKFYMLYGPLGRNGKGLLTQSVEKAMGALVYNIPADAFMEATLVSQGGARADIIPLKERSIAFTSELSESKKFDAEFIKRITGRDTISSRGLYKEQEEFKPTFTIFLLTNKQPKAPRGEGAEGFWRRLRIIPFSITFVENPSAPNERKIDTGLKDYIENNELAGIQNMLIEYAQKWIDNDYTIEPNGYKPSAIQQTIDNYKETNDPLVQFVKERLEKDNSSSLPFSVVYEEYKDWCDSMEIQQRIAKRYFSKELGGVVKSIRKDSSNCVFVDGYKIAHTFASTPSVTQQMTTIRNS